MKKLFFISIVAGLPYFNLSKVEAQDYSTQMIAILDSIKFMYADLPTYHFSYMMKSPTEKSNKNDMVIYKMDKEKNCDDSCICHSNISFKGDEKPYMIMFSLSSFDSKTFYIADSILYLKTFVDDMNIPISISHPDKEKLLKIKKWMEMLCGYCEIIKSKN